MEYVWTVFLLLWTVTNAGDIDLIECPPPDLPRYGGYGPRQDFYLPGDSVHYFCDADTFIGGNYYRRCEDTGDWSGDTPVCDTPSGFSSYSQSSVLDDVSSAYNAIDGIKTSCSSTAEGEKGEWSGTFTAAGQLIRVMLFFPRGPTSFEVVLVKTDGSEIVCGNQTRNIDRYEWTFQNCPEPHNANAAGIKIRSLNDAPLKICELQAYLLTSPKCTDPHVRVENGRIQLDRKLAILRCDQGFTKSPDDRLECIRDGVWTRKPLYCIERQWELDPDSSNDRDNGGMDPRRGNTNN